MLRRLLSFFAAALLALLLAAGAAAAAIPPLRQIVVAAFNAPERMPRLDIDPRIHFEPGAEACAAAAAQLLPAAVARIERAQGRPFAHPVTIGIYASADAYARANAAGTAAMAGTTAFDRITLSPQLCGPERARLEGILTHELSHAHLQGWLSPLAFFALPSWFREGLAVYVAPGDGGSRVTADAARAAIAAGIAIAATEEGSLLNLGANIRFVRPVPPDLRPAGLAYREAALFITYLHDEGPREFAVFLDQIENGVPFKTAFGANFGASAATRWKDFAATVTATRPPEPFPSR